MPVQVLEGGEDLLDRGALMISVAGILEAQLTQHIALFEKMCGPVKHVRLAVRRRKKGGQRKRVVVDVASWEAEFDKYWALEWGELLAALRDETGSARKKRKKHL